MKRLVVLVVTSALLMIGALPASAQEIDDYIDKQGGATYEGQQTVVCVTPDGNLTQLASVQQTAGLRVSEREDGSLVVSQVDTDERPMLADRYTVTPARPGTFLNRDVVRYNVLDEGVLRMALTFDQATGALLESETFNADGSLYCRNRLVTFQADVAGELGTYSLAPQGSPIDAPSEDVEEQLPATVASFQRVAIYEWSDRDIVTGHYSDGLFSMTIFVSDRDIEVAEMADREPVELDTGTYQRSFDVGKAVYAWRSADGGYVLVGDMPLDMQEEVLGLLPAPEELSFFSRLWRSIFRR